MSTYVSCIELSFDLPCLSPWSAICKCNISFILSTIYSLFTDLFKLEFILGIHNLAPPIWPYFPWRSSSTIPTFHIDLDSLSSSTITAPFNCICGLLNFCNFRYSIFKRFQQWFRILLIFLDWTFKLAGEYISNGSGWKSFSCLPNNKWFGVKDSSPSSW